MQRCEFWRLRVLLAWGMVALVTFSTPGHAEDWNQFRGPTGQGISSQQRVPLHWNRQMNVLWSAPLPAPGNSSPIHVKNKVFLTGTTDKGKHRSLYCFALETGQLSWTRTVEFAGDEPTHSTNPHGGATPAADADRVVAWHSSAGLYCYDHYGREKWHRDLGPFVHIWGYGGSPIIHADTVFLLCGPGKRTFVIALDKRTGATLWQRDEPGGASGLPEPHDKSDNKADTQLNAKPARPAWIGSWSTPMVHKVAGKEQLVVSLPHHVRAYDLRSGEILWTCAGLGDLVYTSVVMSDQFGIAMSGYHGPAIGFRLDGQGDTTAKSRLWQHVSANPQRIGSGVIVGEFYYILNEPGIAQCLEVATGKERWKQRVAGGPVWGSTVYAAGRFYTTNRAGTTIVWAPNPQKFEMITTNKLDEPSDATPAVLAGKLLLRTNQALYCISDSSLEEKSLSATKSPRSGAEPK